MKTGFAVVGFVVVALVVGTCVACTEDDDESLARTVLVASHEWDDGGSDGNTGYDGEGGRSGDMEQGDGRNCRNFCDNVIYIPDPRGGEEEQPR